MQRADEALYAAKHAGRNRVSALLWNRRMTGDAGRLNRTKTKMGAEAPILSSESLGND